MTVPLRRRGVLMLVLLAAVVVWLALSRGALRGRDAAATPGRPSSASSPAGAAVLARILSIPASAASVVVSAGERASEVAQAHARAQLMQRMKADWCGFGAAEYGRQSEAILARVSAGNGMVGMEAIEQLKLTPGQEVVDDAIGEVRRRWVKALTQRGDPRSLAVADFIGDVDDDAAQARARLQALARTSSDPMVTALALQRPCAAGTCRNIEASQWSRLEPANLQAWLTLLRDAKGGAQQSQAVYALERMAAEGRYSRTYEREFKAVLLSLPQTPTPGLASEAEMQLISGTAAAWAIAGFKPLTDACQGGAAGSLQRCEAVLERLWEGDNLLDRAVALGLARRLVLPARPGQRARWEPRAREYEAVSSWRDPALEKTALDRPACEGQAEMRKLLQGMTALGEWGHQRAEMLAAGADDAALSAQWRRERGRSALDPDTARR